MTLLTASRQFDRIESEGQLASLALVLAQVGGKVTAEEKALGRGHGSPSDALVERVTGSILAGSDPLGDSFMSVRSGQERRRSGAVYTPNAIVASMMAWARRYGTPSRVVDPGAGTGRFVLAAARSFPTATLVAVEIDPLATLMLKGNAHVMGLGSRLTVEALDYRLLSLPACEGRTLFLGNPPYVRHHEISSHWKTWFAESAGKLGLKASKLAGLHAHFFLRTAQLARAGDYGAFITSAEWLDVNYGSVLRQLIARHLGGVGLHMIAPTALPFEGTNTTGLISTFEVGSGAEALVVDKSASMLGLGDLRSGSRISRDRAMQEDRWSALFRPRSSSANGSVELGELFRVHRGQVTGANKVWIEGAYRARLPERYLFPTVTRARELIEAAPTLDEHVALRRVLDLPPDLEELSELEGSLVLPFLEWAKAQGANDGYVARHRRSWWSVGLRAPAPVLVTYMARRAPTFVLNPGRARHINVAHGLYPRAPLSQTEIETVVTWLNHTVSVEQGRTYAGGLTKFEPKELERIRIPPLEELNAVPTSMEPRRTDSGRHGSPELFP